MKRVNNTEFVTNIMERSQCGALIQPFVLEALWHYSRHVVNNPIKDSNGLINWEVWTRCAEEILTKLEERHAPTT